MNLTGELRTPHFPSDKYPEHWGPFELHTMVPYDRGLQTLEVTNYQIVIEYKPANKSVVVGFDDFAPAWPIDRDEELSPKAIRRREKYREMAQFRALVKIKKVSHLSAQGIEQLRNAGADVSEEACRQGLWIAVYGKYDNYPSYHPGKNARQLIQVQVIHQDESQTVRKLHIASMDPRTAVRSFLYFERIKLIRFMEEVSRQDNGRTEIRDRTIEWFVKKMMEMFPTDETSVPEKRDNYRGARRHTSEARHVFVCHAEWLLAHTTIHQGAERHISRRVLQEWVDLAPQMREIAAREERAGWGVWDAVWDKVDFTEWYKKEHHKFNYYLKVLAREKGQDKYTPSSSRRRRSAVKTALANKGKGRATTADEEQHAYRWIPDPVSDEEEDDGGVSLDEAEWASRAKRPRIDSNQDAGPSGTQLTRSSQSLGDGPDDHISSSLSRDHYQPSPSLGHQTPSSIRNPTATSQLPGSARGSSHRTPSSSGQNPSSNWRFTSQRGPSPATPATSRKSLETRRSHLSPQVPPLPEATDVIYVSSDDDIMPELTADVARSSIAPRSEVIDITDSDGDASMRAVSEMRDLEDVPTQGRDDYDEPPFPRQRTSVRRETVVHETPPPGSRLQPSSRRPESPPIEEVSDSQEDFNSSDSESKYGQPTPRPPTPKRLRTERLIKLNDAIHAFVPMVHSTVYAPQTWKKWRCNYPHRNFLPGCDPKAARAMPCSFMIDLQDANLEVQQLLNQDPADAEFLKHLLTKPVIFRGPTDELPVAIFTRIVELHREEHFRRWKVKRVITEVGGEYRAHFEPLDEDEY
ncbi:hypothetical protein ACGC1H_005890 [Rhizoctonia solani]|uniref:Uncharacterized protein n=1 Tax=Rhizoctonia solani TaxID=456999 RepID=A0A8H3C1E1_9AGAM|nr:unnamed protein product [Rhizoctonia solani]